MLFYSLLGIQKSCISSLGNTYKEQPRLSRASSMGRFLEKNKSPKEIYLWVHCNQKDFCTHTPWASSDNRRKPWALFFAYISDSRKARILNDKLKFFKIVVPMLKEFIFQPHSSSARDLKTYKERIKWKFPVARIYKPLTNLNLSKGSFAWICMFKNCMLDVEERNEITDNGNR